MSYPDSLMAAVEKAIAECKRRWPEMSDYAEATHPSFGPLTSHVAERWGKSHVTTYRALLRAEKLGMVVRHQPYACAIRWWIPTRKVGA